MRAMTPRPKKMWLARLLQQLGVKWVAAVIVAVIGALGAVANSFELEAQRETINQAVIVYSDSTRMLQRQIDTLKVEVALLKKAQFRVVRLNKQDSDALELATANDRGVFSRIGSAVASIWPFGKKGEPT